MLYRKNKVNSMLFKYKVKERSDNHCLIEFEHLFTNGKNIWLEIWIGGMIYSNIEGFCLEYDLLEGMQKIVKKELFKIKCKLFKRI